jgi:hypothetical protein
MVDALTWVVGATLVQLWKCGNHGNHVGQIAIVAIEIVAVLVPVTIRETRVITTMNLELYEMCMKWPGH